MRNEVKKRIYASLSDQTFRNDNELYLYLILLAATGFAITIHIFLFFIHLVMRACPMALINAAGIVLFFVNIHVVRHRRYAAAGIILSLDVLLYSVFAVFLTGSNTGLLFYLFLVVMMQLIIPYARAPVRAAVIALSWMVMLFMVLSSNFLHPLHPLGEYQLYMVLINTHVGFVGAMSELFLSNYFKKIIALFHAEQLKKITDQANTDQLTGLFNRRYAHEYFSHIAANQKSRSYVTAILDIDDFKQINDRYGHNIGDIALREISAFLRRSLRKTDIIFRWGGEEFLLLLESDDLEVTRLILEKLRRGIEEFEIKTEKGPLHMTVTIGMSPFDPGHIEESINHSDEKMYYGKQQGKNCVIL